MLNGSCCVQQKDGIRKLSVPKLSSESSFLIVSQHGIGSGDTQVQTVIFGNRCDNGSFLMYKVSRSIENYA